MNTEICQRKIEIVVAIWIDGDANAQDVVADCDYNFEHPAIRRSEILGFIAE